MDETTGVWRVPHQRACPRCTYPMTALAADGTEVDHCHRCGGILVEPKAAVARLGPYADPGHWLTSLAQQVTGERLRCPVDGGLMTGFQVPSRTRSVVVDHCGDCGSLWFDQDEGEKLVDIIRETKATGALGEKPGVDTWLADKQLLAEQDRAEKPGVGSYLFQLFSGLPVEVWNPVHGTPVATRALFAAILLITGLEFAYLLSVSEAAQLNFLQTFGLVGAHVGRGEHLWSLVTYGFLHGGFAHLLGNAYFLWIFGDNVEDRVGRGPFLLLYGVALFASGVLHLVFQSDPTVPLIGASGAIAGLMGAYLVLFPKVKVWMVFFFMRWRVPVMVYLGFWAALQVGMALIGVPGVGWWAHIGGFIVGLGFGYLMRDIPHPLAPEEARAISGAPR